MADRSISLRLAVSGLEESLRAVLGFGEAGQAAFEKIAAKAGLAGAPFDKFADGATRARRIVETEVDAMGAAMDQLEKDRGGTGFVSGAGRDAGAEAQGFLAAERAKQQALAATARAEAEAAAAAEQASQRAIAAGNQQTEAIRRYAAQVNAQYADPGEALANTRSQLNAARAAGFLSEETAARALNAALEQTAEKERQLGLDSQGAAEARAALIATAEKENQEYDRLAAAVQRYRESLDPSIALERQRTDVSAQVGLGLLKETEAYQQLAAAALKAAGVTLNPGQAAPEAVQAFASRGGAGTGAQAIQEARELAAANEQTARAMAETIAQAERENAAYDALVAAAQRYREQIDPTIALERERARISEQVGAGLLDEAQAYQTILRLAQQAAGVKLDPGEAAPHEATVFADRGGGGGGADAIEALQRQAAARDLDRQAQREQQQEEARTKAAIDAETNSLRNLVENLSPMARLKQREADLSRAVSLGLTDEAEKTRLLAVATAQANDQRKQQDRLASGSHGGGSSVGFAVGDVFNQLQDVIVQVEGGTNIFRSLSQQLPQAAGALVYFGGAWTALGPIIGTVAGIAAGAAGVLFALGQSSADAAAAADVQKKATDDLLQSFQLSVKDASEFADGIDRITAAHKDLVGANLSAELDKQAAAAKAAQADLDKLVQSAETAAKSPGFLARLSSGLSAEAGGAPDALPKPDANATTPILAADLEKEYAAFKAGAANVDALRISFELLKESQNVTVDDAQKLASQFVDQASVVREAEEAHKLLIAQYEVFHNRATQEQVDLVNNAEAMKSAAAGAKAYADTLADLRERQRVAAMAPEDAKAYDLQKKGGLFDLQKAVDVEQDPDKKAALASDLRERQTELAVEARATAQAEDLAQSRKKLTDVTQDLAAKEAGLHAGLDKEAAARAKVEGETRRALTVNGQLAAGGEAAIKRAGDEAAAEVRRQDAQSAATKAQGEAARQAEFAASVHQKLADAQKALTEAQAGGTAETKHAIAVRQAEAELLAHHIDLHARNHDRLLAEATATIELTNQTKELLQAQQTLKDLHDKQEQGSALLTASREGLGTAGPSGITVTDLYGGEHNAQGDDVTRAAVAASRDRAAAFHEEAVSLTEVRARADFIRGYVKDVTDPALRTEIIAQANAWYDQSKALDAAAKSQQALKGDDEAIKNDLALLDALKQGTQAFAELQEKQQITGQLKQEGLNPGTPEFDDRFWSEWARRAVEKHKDTAKEAADEWNKALSTALSSPIEEIPKVFGKALDGVFSELNQTGRLNFAQLFTGLAQGVEGVGQNFLANALQLPFKAAGDEFSKILDKSLSKGGGGLSGVFSGVSEYASKGTLQAGIVGAGIGSTVGGIGGTIGTAITGNPNTGLGGSVGGLAGGVFGTILGGPVGGLIGSGIGTALGSVLGGFFGGSTAGKNYDAMNSVYDPSTRTFKSTDKQGSQQNAEAARGLAQQGADVLDIIKALGLDDSRGSFGVRVGPNGVDVGLQHFQTQEEALQALIRQMLDDTVGTVSATMTTVLKNSKAKNAQELQADIAFAGTYDQLTNRSGTYQQALDQLQQTYGTATAQAEKLGLDTSALSTAQAKAEDQLRQQNLVGIRTLMGTASPLAKALLDLNQQFDDAAKNAKALGVSQAELNAAQAQQVALLKQQYQQQYSELTGQSGGFAQALYKLRADFKQAAAIGSDLGIDTSNLPQLQAQQELKLRQQFIDQFNQLTDTSSGLAQTIQQLRDNFKQAADIAKELGLATTGLAAKEHDAEVKAYRDAETQLRQQLSGQAQQVRSFVDGLVSPLKQALSGLGPLAGFTSPTQSIQSGLAEFRKTFQGARNDNVADIQALPQQAQQLLQLARQYLGSGPQFAAIFGEVQDDLKAILDAQETRGNAVEASIPDAIEQSAQQQIDTLTSGFGDVVAQLQQLHDDWTRLEPGQPLPGAPVRPPDAASSGLPATAAARVDIAPLVTAQTRNNALVSDVAAAVRIAGDKQTTVLADGFTRLDSRLQAVEGKLRLLQGGRLGRAA